MAKHIRKPGEAPQSASGGQGTAPFGRVGSQAGAPSGYPRQGVAGNADYDHGAQGGHAVQGGYAAQGGYVQGSGMPQGAGYANYDPGANSPDFMLSQPRNMVVPVKKKKKHRFLKFVATVLILALAAVGAYTLLLNSRLAFDGDTARSIAQQLTDRVAGEPYYVLVLGSDQRVSEDAKWGNEAYMNGNERSDIMILVRVDERNHQVTMLTIPRDTPVHWTDGSTIKINQVYNLGGPAASIEEVSKICGVPISHYVEVHIDGFVNLVDELGGVTVEVPTQLTVQDAVTGEYVTVEPGEQKLTGQQAQVVARARHEYAEGDEMRQYMVRQIVTAVLREAVNRPPYEIPGTVLSIASHVDTDMNPLSIGGMAAAFGMGSDMTIYAGTGPTDGDFTESGAWFCYENPAGWSAVMDVVDSGGDPSTVDADSYQ